MKEFKEETMKTIQGFVLIDVDVAALNNAGKSDASHLENSVATKKIRKNGREYPYVSGQAWRYWWRENLNAQFGWEMSPITREKKIAFTEADPLEYPDDDVFGYMRAGKKDIEDPETGKKKSVNVTLTRISPLKNSALISVAYNPIVQNWASMSRQEGDAVPYGIDEYCAIMKGMFSLDLDWVGTFSEQNRTGFTNINELMKKGYLASGAEEIKDELSTASSTTLVRIPQEIREKRVKDTILALKTLSGGAKQTTNLADVTPKLIVLAQFKSGNHPFSHLAREEKGEAVFSIEALKEVLEDYKDQFEERVYIGRRMGFMDELENKLVELKEQGLIEYGPINEMIDRFVDSINVG
jgi:CRISPR-associated protein Cst2